MLYGARASMFVGIGAAVLTTLSVAVGVAAGYVGGTGDEVLSPLATCSWCCPACR